MIDLAELVSIVGRSHVLSGEDVRARNDAWGRVKPCLARAIVRPGDTAELAAVVRACAQVGQTIVTHGGRTGLAGGAVTGEAEIGLSLERFDRIEAICQQDRSAQVGAGVVVQALQEAAAQADLSFPLDFGARGSATVGGAISTNAGGNRVVRFGMMREQVLGLEVVLANGTVVNGLRGLIKDNSGYDLKHLFIGAEGTLGIITRAVVRLRPRLVSRNAALVAISDFERVLRFMSWIESALGGAMSAFEVMWSEFYDIVTVNHAKSAPLPRGSAFYVLVESEGGHNEADAARFQEAMEDAIGHAMFDDAVIAKSGAERDALWAVRDDIDTLVRLGDHLDFDVSLPASRMSSYVDGVRSTLAGLSPDIRCIAFGHLADGNVHIIASRPTPFDPVLASAVKHAVYDPIRDLDGSISAEHGIGVDKRDFLPMSRSPEQIALMCAVKTMLDPHNLFNPGKIIA